jgi:hypothetical protein
LVGGLGLMRRLLMLEAQSPHPGLPFVSTSCVEKPNLTMCQKMKRFTRLTVRRSKKLENHVIAFYTWYNFARIN